MQNRIIVDRTAGQLDDLFDEISFEVIGPVEIPSNPLQGGDLFHHRLGRGGSTHFGIIHFALPHLNWYRVALDDAHGIIPCCAADQQSPILLGPKGTGMYQPGTGVIVHLFRHPVGLYGVILGAIPSVVVDANTAVPDWVSQGSNVGVRREGYYLNYIEQLGDEGGAIDFSNSRPCDQTCFDWGVMAETGSGIHIDSFMAFLRLDEVCGIWFNYYGQHTTLAGISFELLTGATVERHCDDEGELTVYRGEAPYDWEMGGFFEPGTSNYREVSDKDVHFEQPEAKYEPIAADQQPFHRYQEYGGYLGQGRIRQICVPPPGAASTEVNRLSSAEPGVCVFRESIALNGAYSLASAKEIIVSKRALLPNPHRRKLAEDRSTDADSAENENYKAAGQYGAGSNVKEHKVGDLAVEGNDGLLLTAAGVLDKHAYVFNWQNIHPFHYHARDFLLPEEGENSGSLSKLTAPLDLSSLKSGMWIPRPSPQSLRVDHRYGDVDYFEVLSHFTMSDDGNIVIQGGHGEEIKFVAGNVVISAPGNVMFQPGKGIIGLAGDDIVLRARKSVDVTSALADIRLKAEVNMQMMSGNSGTGCMLIENRAYGTNQDYPEEGGEEIKGTGIIFRCPNSVVGTMASEIYLRTGSDGIAEGPIVIDAAKGRADIRTVSGSFRRYMQSDAIDAFMNVNNKVLSTNRYNQSYALLGTQCRVNGSIDVNGVMSGRGPLQLSDGHVNTPQGGDTGRLRNVNIIRINITKSTAEAEERLIESATQDHESFIKERYYGSQQIGGEETQKSVSFSLRNEEQYCTENFRLPQVHWQVLEEQSGEGTVWNEPVVKYQDKIEQQPWPGKKAWESSTGFLMLSDGAYHMYDVEQGKDKDRGGEDSPYEDPKYGQFTERSASSYYKILDC